MHDLGRAGWRVVRRGRHRRRGRLRPVPAAGGPGRRRRAEQVHGAGCARLADGDRPSAGPARRRPGRATRSPSPPALRAPWPPAPDWLLTTWRHDGHPDHEATGPSRRRGGRWTSACRWPSTRSGRGASPPRRPSGRGPSPSRHRAAKRGRHRRLPQPARAQSQRPAGRAGRRPGRVRPSRRSGHRLPMKVPTSHFDEGYAADPDPWRFASSAYEQRRYDLTVAALPRRRFERAFEPACAIGELTPPARPPRCDEVVAVGLLGGGRRRGKTAHQRAQRRQLGRLGRCPSDWPDGTFDLVVLSEVGYYFTRRPAAGCCATGPSARSSPAAPHGGPLARPQHRPPAARRRGPRSRRSGGAVSATAAATATTASGSTGGSGRDLARSASWCRRTTRTTLIGPCLAAHPAPPGGQRRWTGPTSGRGGRRTAARDGTAERAAAAAGRCTAT